MEQLIARARAEEGVSLQAGGVSLQYHSRCPIFTACVDAFMLSRACSVPLKPNISLAPYNLSVWIRYACCRAYGSSLVSQLP